VNPRIDPVEPIEVELASLTVVYGLLVTAEPQIVVAIRDTHACQPHIDLTSNYEC
jgi:hypothetical protein